MGLLSATPKQVVLSRFTAINPTLPYPLSDAEIYLGHPRVDSDGVTTIVPSVAMLGGDYTGYVDLRYKRLNLSTLFDQRPIIKAPSGATLLSQMLPLVNKWLGLNLDVSDIVETYLSLGSGEEVNIQIKTNPNSYGYTGTFTFRYFRTRPYLVYVVKQINLGVLKPDPGAQTGKQSITMAMWNEDFTNYVRDGTLKVNQANTYWTNLNGVKQVMADFGYANFPAPQINGVTDYATTKVPTANPNFDRVIIQKAVVGDTYAGDAYFHYNLNV